MILQEHSSTPFWYFNVGHMLELGAFVVAWLAYRGDRKKDERDRLAVRVNLASEQAKNHAENSQRLDNLTAFHTAQQVLNGKRDEQISQLCQQTASLIQIASGQERRLQMLENR